MSKTTQEIINQLNSILNPIWIFEMDDIYGDRGGIPYPPIEELDVLYYKFNGKKYSITKSEEFETIKKIKELNIGSVEILNIMAIGKFIFIKLHKFNERLIGKYLIFNKFKESNLEKINSIYEQLDKNVPIDFIAYDMYYNK